MSFDGVFLGGCSPAVPASASPAGISSATPTSVQPAIYSERKTVALHPVSQKGAPQSSEFHNLHQVLGGKLLILRWVLRVRNMFPNQVTSAIDIC
jgi:hypothetical protein